MSSAASAPDGHAFRPLFERWSRRVRGRLALRYVLTGAAVGLLVGAGAAGVAWRTRQGPLRPASAAAGVIGAAAGLAAARRRRWQDTEVALYLDAKLGAGEAIATAVEIEATAARAQGDGGEGQERISPARAYVLAQAEGALGRATPNEVRAPLFRPLHAALPVAAAAIAWLTWLPLPPPPASAAPPPGAEKVKLAEVAGLEKVIKLAEVDARDPAQQERLKKLAEEAKRIREKLREGTEKREAQADIARLRDAITAERLSLGDGQQRPGMEAALGKLGENPDMKDAEKALGDRDLVAFDDAMEKLANKLEKKDRDQAQKTLEEAAEAARKAGSPDVARALEEQKKLLAERGKDADKLRELAKELGEGLSVEGKEALRDLNESGSGKDAQKLADALEKSLEKLSPEQRKKLAENLKKKIAKQSPESLGEGPSKEQLEELAEQLDTPEGQKQLEEALKRLAEADPESEEAERQKALDDAQEGAGEAEGQMNGAPVPLPVAGAGQPPGGKGGQQGKGDGEAQSGHSKGDGRGGHAGQTGRVDGGKLSARAQAEINKGKPMPGVVMGRSPGRAGETANIAGEGALGQAGPGEVGGVERSEVPEEYREQVGRYFQP